MLDKVQRLYGDRKPTNIIVRRAKENPFVFGWTNDTLTQQSCPKGDILDLFNMLIDGNTKQNMGMTAKPSKRLKMLLGDKIFVKSVKMSFLGTCLVNEPNSPINSNVGSDNSVPIMRNPIDRLNITAGELLRFKVPEVIKPFLSSFIAEHCGRRRGRWIEMIVHFAGHLFR